MYPTTRFFGSDPTASFAVKLSPSGSSLAYSTFIPKANCVSIAVDGDGEAYIACNTDTEVADPFTTPGAFQRDKPGSRTAPAYVLNLNASGSGVIYATFLGGSGGTRVSGIAVDGDGQAYVAGRAGGGFPTRSPLPRSPGGGIDAFVTKFNSAGSDLVYSTYLGGSNSEQADGIALDEQRSAYIVGNTKPADFPVVNPAQAACN